MNVPPTPRAISSPWRSILTRYKIFTIHRPVSDILSVLGCCAQAYFGLRCGSLTLIFQINRSIFGLYFDIRWICSLGNLVYLLNIIHGVRDLHVLTRRRRPVLG